MCFKCSVIRTNNIIVLQLFLLSILIWLHITPTMTYIRLEYHLHWNDIGRGFIEKQRQEKFWFPALLSILHNKNGLINVWIHSEGIQLASW